MPPKRQLPECYEERSDKKVRCKICPNTNWAVFQKGHMQEHLKSAKHRQAEESAKTRAAGRTDIEQRLAGPSRVLNARPGALGITLANLCLLTFQPVSNWVSSEAENSMWQNYNKYNAGFSAGNQISEDDIQQKVEQEMDMMGIWDAVELGCQLDGELDNVRNPAPEDDALLAEVLQALDADPFDATEAKNDYEKSTEWYPYTSKTMLLLDICDNLPRLPISESLMRIFIWILRECGAKDVPSLDALCKTQKHLHGRCGVPTIPCTSVQGNNFCINDPKAIIQMECSNVEIHSQFHLYPEINMNRSVSEIWHGEKLCNEINPELLTPMFDAGNGVHYYVNEVTQLTDGRFVIPFRWIKVDKLMHADTNLVKMDDQVRLSNIFENRADVKKDILRVSASLLAFNFLDLECKNQVLKWSDTFIKDGNQQCMPSLLRATVNGDLFYTIFVDYFSDDVSRNRSKSWNKHWNAYLTNCALPRELLQHEFYVHFILTSQHVSVPEQFREFQKLIKIILNADPSDNPMQAEVCSCMGATANYLCRKCKIGGNQGDKATDEGYHAMFSCGEARSKNSIFKVVQQQIHLACEGNETELKKSYTSSGVKDKYTKYWINDILSQFKKAVQNGEPKPQVTDALKKWVKDHSNEIYSPFLTTDSVDAPRDTPIELLHTILLGVLKYLWHVTHTSWTSAQKKLFELHLQATNTSGLSIEGIRAGYISTVFQIHDLVDETKFQAWKALGDLAALLWMPEIDDMETYCQPPHSIVNFLDSFAEIDPSKMVTKVKTHLLTHAPANVHLFGPLLGAITEAFESFNGVFRGASILSNHRAPSRDIAIWLAALEGVKHRAAVGAWPLKGADGDIIWTCCGPSACELLQERLILQRLLDWKKFEVLRPVSEWYRCQSIVSQSQEACHRDSWVIASGLLSRDEPVAGKIVEILQQINGTGAIVILEHYAVQPKRHEVYNMPFMSPRRCEEAVYLILNPENIKFSFNAQYDCSSGTCKASGKKSVLQDRRQTNLESTFIKHDPLVTCYIINTTSLHNPHLIRRVLPPDWIKPASLWDDRVLLHRKQAERLCTGREVRRIKNAATAGARKAAKAAAGIGLRVPPKRNAATRKDLEGPRTTKKRKTVRSLEESDDDESNSDASEEEIDEGGDVDHETRPLPQRAGLRVCLPVNYKVEFISQCETYV
ncbi:hypothetical protein K438DRAFT_2097776 [Mycena galopus ATCC 62051]|nr:hypothetical protein K438DRAFT_2097776 [Mycena galopus ATCC 62051]